MAAGCGLRRATRAAWSPRSSSRPSEPNALVPLLAAALVRDRRRALLRLGRARRAELAAGAHDPGERVGERRGAEQQRQHEREPSETDPATFHRPNLPGTVKRI